MQETGQQEYCHCDKKAGPQCAFGRRSSLFCFTGQPNVVNKLQR